MSRFKQNKTKRSNSSASLVEATCCIPPLKKPGIAPFPALLGGRVCLPKEHNTVFLQIKLFGNSLPHAQLCTHTSLQSHTNCRLKTVLHPFWHRSTQLPRDRHIFKWQTRLPSTVTPRALRVHVGFETKGQQTNGVRLIQFFLTHTKMGNAI